MTDDYVLTESNFLIFTAKQYDATNKFFSDNDYFEDLQKIKYVKRLLNKFVETGELRERLILNHIIVLNNVFGPFATSRMLFLKLKGYEEYLKPFLEMINILPDIVIVGHPKRTIITSQIKSNEVIVEALKKING